MLAAQRRNSAAAPAVAACMAAATWGSPSYALLLQETPPSPRFWLTAMCVGVVATPPTFLVFTLLYANKAAGRDRVLLADPVTV